MARNKDGQFDQKAIILVKQIEHDHNVASFYYNYEGPEEKSKTTTTTN